MTSVRDTNTDDNDSVSLIVFITCVCVCSTSSNGIECVECVVFLVLRCCHGRRVKMSSCWKGEILHIDGKKVLDKTLRQSLLVFPIAADCISYRRDDKQLLC